MTDLNVKINLEKAVFYELLEKINPYIEDKINKEIKKKLQSIFTQYHKDDNLEKLRKKIMDL